MINKKVLYLMSSLGMLFSLVLIPGDLQFIKQDLQNSYIAGRIIWFILLFGITVHYHIKKDSNFFVSSFLIIMILYSFHGQIFVPGYYLGFGQMVILVGLFFPLDKFFYRTLLISSSVIMSLIIWYSDANYADIQNLSWHVKFRTDAIIGIWLIATSAFVGHSEITIKRQEKDEAYRKFLDIGKYSSFLFHDFKGLLTTPIFYADMLQETIKSGKDSSDIIAKLNEDLSFLQEYSKEIMKLTLPDSNAYQQKEILNIDQIEKTLRILLRKPLQNIQLEIDKKENLVQPLNSFKLVKILYNATMNSAENFKTISNKDQKIVITFNKDSILISDNGSGFPPSILKKLNSEDVTVSTKIGGSGIGTAIIKDLVKNMDGKVRFYNNQGAVVEILFN